jgi:hypothetical protein
MHVIGVRDSNNMANEFAKYFSQVYFDSSSDGQSIQEFLAAYSSNHCNRNSHDIDCISVELVDKCMRDLEKGKACGPDGLCSVSLLFAHPKLVMLLCNLLCSIALHSSVPANFGTGLIVPLVNDKLNDLSSYSNYRAITLIAVISKLFEKVMLHISGIFEDRRKTILVL